MRKLLFTFLTVLSISVAAQRPKSVDRNIPFDTTLDKLPLKFQGTDSIAMVAALIMRSAAMKKNEFETTAAFDARTAKLRSVPLLGSIKENSLLAFLLPSDAVETKYDADKKLLLAVLQLQLDPRIGARGEYEINGRMLKLVEIYSTSTYIGQNAFGAKMQVRRTQGRDIGLNFFGPKMIAFQDKTGLAYRMQFPTEPIVAMNMKRSLRAIVVGQLSNTDLTLDSTYSKPTFDNPVEVAVDSIRLHFFVQEIWFFNGDTGEIYGKLNQEAVKNAK